MSVYAQITYQNISTSYPDTQGGQITIADVYISIFDSVTNVPVSGNGGLCSYSRDETTDGSVVSYPGSATISGFDYSLGSGITISETHYDSGGNLISSFGRSFTITGFTSSQPDICDIAVSASKTNETAQSANDGTITASAISSFSGVQYSLDAIHFQSSGTFTGLAPGTYTVYAKDSHPCVATTQVVIVAYINPIYQNNFTSALPVVQLPSGNISKWNAAYNPVTLKYQRRDALVTGVVASGSDAVVTLNRTLSVIEISNALTDNTYLNTASYDYYGPAQSHVVVGGFSVLTFTGLFSVVDTVGFINVPNAKPGYRIVTEITSGTTKITCTHSPNKKGFTNGDISGLLKTIVSPNETNDFTSVNFLDKNLSQAYSIRYQEVWDTDNGQWFTGPYSLYTTYTAKQLSEAYGSNMAAYVTFAATDKAKWLTEFEMPVLNVGLPFDLSFIYSENLIGLQLFAEIIPNVVGATGTFLLNSTGGFLLTSNGSKIAITSNALPPISLGQKVGINRFNVPQNFDPSATSAIVNIYYINGSAKVYVMQPITIKISQPCSDPYVYLKWINHLGGADYFRFGYNQLISGDVTNVQILKRYVDDWANSDTIEDLANKTIIDKINVGCDMLTPAEVKGLRSLRKSIKTQMLISDNPVIWNTVIPEDGTYDTFETRRNSGSANFTIYLPSTNTQYQ